MFRPPVNRAMRVLDRSFFKQTVQLSAARVHDIKNLSRIRNELDKSKDLLTLRMLTPVRLDPTDTSKERRCILLRSGIKVNERGTWGEQVTRLHSEGSISLFPYTISLDYNHWTAAEILGAILPEDILSDIPAGFNPVGHVAHFNLREQYLPHKYLIGQVTIDKNPTIKTAINKTETLGIKNEYRVLDYEVIAGEPNLNVEVREAGSTFRFDYSKVFWNTRLGTEHDRLVQKFQPGEAVCDVMAGVGPFAIPAGKKKVFVWANDLNPDCFQGLIDAISVNKVGQFVRGFNEDGHDFIKNASQALRDGEHIARVPIKISRIQAMKQPEDVTKRYVEFKAPRTFSHFVMNLPAIATDFLVNFVGIYEGCEHLFQPVGAAKLPWIHCYCFGPKTDDSEQDLKAAQELIWSHIASKVGGHIDAVDSEAELVDVRDVAPNKRQYCATFRLPPSIAFQRHAFLEE